MFGLNAKKPPIFFVGHMTFLKLIKTRGSFLIDLWVTFIAAVCPASEWSLDVVQRLIFYINDWDICVSLVALQPEGGILLAAWWSYHVKWWHALTKCCVISTAIGVTSSLYSQIIFCMTLVRSSFSVSLTMCRSACITGRMKGTMYSLAKEQNKQDH